MKTSVREELKSLGFRPMTKTEAMDDYPGCEDDDTLIYRGTYYTLFAECTIEHLALLVDTLLDTGHVYLGGNVFSVSPGRIIRALIVTLEHDERLKRATRLAQVAIDNREGEEEAFTELTEAAGRYSKLFGKERFVS